MSFGAFQLDRRITAGVEALGYQVPTPIQRQAIPPILAGRDVMGLAQTGTGKTAAFVLPILQRLLPGTRGHVRALILAPTRELAEQTHTAIGLLGGATGLRSATIYGGVGRQPQIAALRRGVDIVVACPGRLLDHIAESTIALSHIEVLVLDEADMMLDMGFLPDIRRILRHLPEARQNLLFSATMPPDIRRLAEDVLHNPVTLQAGSAQPIGTVAHALYPVAQHLKTHLLMALLDQTDTESVLVFTRTKHRAKRVGEQLQKAGYSSASLQGNLAQARRQEALDGFRDGSYQILVATDIAARGLDISLVSHVINYDMPSTAGVYTHRIGRTGRAAKTGDAFTLVTPEDADMVRDIERLLGAPVPRRTLPGFDYTVTAPNRDTEFARPPLAPRRRPSAQAPAAVAAAPPAARSPQQPDREPRPSQPVRTPAPHGAPSQRRHRPRRSRAPGV
ncbi:MAG: DEAD/DEAH box helicase [Chloroflexia bacterium]